MLTNTRIEVRLSRMDKDTKNENKASNELYISKLITCNNLSVKELYPKMVEFLSGEMEEPVIKQYLDSAAENATYTGKDSSDSFLKAMNSYFPDQVNEELQAAEGIVVFADEATSNSRKEMMGVSVAYFSEKAECFKLDFIGPFSVSSMKAEILLGKIKRFTCFDGTNAMSGTKAGLQHRFQGEAPYSIYVNCRCHRLALFYTVA